jgi:hypothetical protein
MKPIVRAGTSPGHYITWILFTLSVIGLIASLTGRNYSETFESTGTLS